MNKSQIAISIFDKLAYQYQEKFMDVSGYHNSFDLFCEAIKKENPSILELACGPGNITQYLLKERPDFQILGTDLSPKMIELAKNNNPTATFKLMDARHINKLTTKYDGIMCGFCLPYLSKKDVLQLIQNASNVLNQNGVIYISTMEDDYSKSGFKKGSSGDEMYMYYHEGDYLTSALEENGFEVMQLIRQDYPEQNGEITTDLIIIAKK